MKTGILKKHSVAAIISATDAQEIYVHCNTYGLKGSTLLRRLIKLLIAKQIPLRELYFFSATKKISNPKHVRARLTDKEAEDFSTIADDIDMPLGRIASLLLLYFLQLPNKTAIFPS